MIGTKGVVRNADAGEPLMSVLMIADLDDLINEGVYWRKLGRIIEQKLKAQRVISGRKEWADPQIHDR